MHGVLIWTQADFLRITKEVERMAKNKLLHKQLYKFDWLQILRYSQFQKAS